MNKLERLEMCYERAVGRGDGEMAERLLLAISREERAVQFKEVLKVTLISIAIAAIVLLRDWALYSQYTAGN